MKINMFNKKIKKLIRDPRLFFSDMAIKQGRKICFLKPKKIMDIFNTQWFRPSIMSVDISMIILKAWLGKG